MEIPPTSPRISPTFSEYLIESHKTGFTDGLHSISHKIHSILSKNKKTGYEDLENKLRDDDTLLCMFKQTYVFCNMYEGLSFRDKLRIKIGAMTMPQVSVNEEIDNMNAHEFVIKWKEFVEK